MVEQKRKKRLIGGLAAAAFGVLAVVLGAVFYRAAGAIDRTDPMFALISAGIFLFLTGGLMAGSTLFGADSVPESTRADREERIKRLTQTALMAALAYIGFQVFRFDIPVGTERTAFHLGNTFVVLAALLLGGTWGGLSGAVGLTIADLTSGYVTSAPKTFFLKLCIGLVTGFVAHRLGRLSKEQSPKKTAVVTVLASACGMAFNVVADPLVGYFYKKVLFGIPQDMAAALAKMSMLTTFVNAVVAVAFASVFYLALRPILKRTNLLIKVK